LIAGDEAFTDTQTITGVTLSNAEAFHLHLEKRYYWKVIARSSGTTHESEVCTFMTNPATPRWIRVHGATNIRDIGGWAIDGGGEVRQAMMYRGPELNNTLCVASRDLRFIEEKLGIRPDLDLRGHAESAGPAMDENKVDCVIVPIHPYAACTDDDLAELYQKIFSMLADPARYPIYCHCLGGADRAGAVTFLVNGLLGVSTNDLIVDFELTSLSVWGERSAASNDFIGLLRALSNFGPVDGTTACDAVENYLLHIGVSTQPIASIHEILTDTHTG
jgi:protein-tyrosine phosphatase